MVHSLLNATLPEKEGATGDFAIRFEVQIPPRPPQTNPALYYETVFRGSVPFSEDLSVFIVTDEFEPCFN